MKDNPATWNKAYATALREFAADLEAKLSKNPQLSPQNILKALHMYADAIWPEENQER